MAAQDEDIVTALKDSLKKNIRTRTILETEFFENMTYFSVK